MSDEFFRPIGPIKRMAPIERELHGDSPDAVAARLLAKPAVVHLFTDGPDGAFNIMQYVLYLKGILGPNFTIDYNGDLVRYSLSQNPDKRDQILQKLARARRPSPFETPQISRRLEEEIAERDPKMPVWDFAQKRMSDSNAQIGCDYEISPLADAIRFMTPDQMRITDTKSKNIVLVVTGRRIGEREIGGFHLRGGFSSGTVSLVSTTGLVEAPGKPLEVVEAFKSGLDIPFFENEGTQKKFDEAVKRSLGINAEIMRRIIQELFKDKMLDHKDLRINEAVKGISLSMILSAFGEYGRVSKCSTSDLSEGKPDMTKFCRLHDAHWQEELINAQLKPQGQPEFCNYHSEVFKKLKLS